MEFKEWLRINEDERRTNRIGLYPEPSDQLGQYPPLYVTPHAADFLTYAYIAYPKGWPWVKPGIMKPRPATYRDDPTWRPAKEY